MSPKLKTFTQAYFLIKNNPAYQNSLVKRAQFATASLFFISFGLSTIWRSRNFGTENVH